MPILERVVLAHAPLQREPTLPPAALLWRRRELALQKGAQVAVETLGLLGVRQVAGFGPDFEVRVRQNIGELPALGGWHQAIAIAADDQRRHLDIAIALGQRPRRVETHVSSIA
jgi:hypothetical protein